MKSLMGNAIKIVLDFPLFLSTFKLLYCTYRDSHRFDICNCALYLFLDPLLRSSHFNMEMYRLATVGGFIVVALVLGVVVYKTCSWPRLE